MKEMEIIIPDIPRTERDDELDIIDRKMADYVKQKLRKGKADNEDYDKSADERQD